MKPPSNSYFCPVCDEEIDPAGRTTFDCPACQEPLTLSIDAEFSNGMWRDKSKLLSVRPHIERMIQHSIRHDELMDALINKRGDRVMGNNE